MEKTRIGVIGCGYWGPNLVRNFSEISTSELVAVADLNEDRLRSIKNLHHELVTTSQYPDLFEMNLEGVVIATPPKTHFSIAKDAINHGLNVMIEKPITTSVQDAEELIELAEKKGCLLMVGHTFIYNNAVHALKKLIYSGEFGRILYLDTARLSLGLYQRGLNVLWDLAPHDLSILNFLLETNPLSVEVFGTSCVMKDIHDVVHLNLLYPDNIMAHIHVSWLAPVKVRRVTVVGSKKMAVYNDIEVSDKIKIYDKGVEPPEIANSFAEWQCGYRSGDILIPSIRCVEPLRQECQHFVDCIRDKVVCQSPGKEGLKVIKIIEAAQNALMDGHREEVFSW